MAYGTSAITELGSTTALTANAPASVSAGDYLGILINQGGNRVITAPNANWTLRADASLTFDGQTFQYWDCTATGSDSYAFTSNGADIATLITLRFTGRTGGGYITTNKDNTTGNNANALPYTVSCPGVTALAGDDLLFLNISDFSTNSNTSSTAAPTSFTSRQQDTTTASTGSACTQNNVSAGATGTISANVTRLSGADNSGWATILIAIQTGPAITVQPRDQRIYEGQTATFSVTAAASGGGGSLSYQWKKNGSSIGGATSSSYTTPTETFADNLAIFTCDVTDANATKTTNGAYLIVQQTGKPWLWIA